jgi:nucleotide sugar dehydrogenase
MPKIIGFIGQGWIGKNYADDFERRGFSVVRYGLEEPHVHNGDEIAKCDIVFIAVPTPTTPEGFDESIVRSAVKKIGKGKTVVIKSTILPGTTESIQEKFKDVFVVHSPEFLREASAAEDAANPQRNIIGIPVMDENYKKRAQEIIDVLPKAPFELICSSREAELIKYAGNVFLYFKVIYANLFYDLAEKLGCNWEAIRDAVAADPRIGRSHLDPVHMSGHGTIGRGAGGHCFIKDFAAFSEIYGKLVGDEYGLEVLKSLKEKNIDLLVSSNKDLDLLEDVYGKEAFLI